MWLSNVYVDVCKGTWATVFLDWGVTWLTGLSPIRHTRRGRGWKDIQTCKQNTASVVTVTTAWRCYSCNCVVKTWLGVEMEGICPTGQKPYICWSPNYPGWDRKENCYNSPCWFWCIRPSAQHLEGNHPVSNPNLLIGIARTVRRQE